jgi:galactose-1-phosphate uridylyltransferase
MDDRHLSNITKLKQKEKKNIVPILSILFENLSNMFENFKNIHFPTYTHMVNIEKRVNIYPYNCM